MKIYRLLLLAAAMMAATITALCQSVEPFNPYSDITPGVESFSMTKYGSVSPSLYTGAMSYSLPVYTYTDPDFTIPVSLEYNFDGFRPSQSSGSVGYGWHLNCGGVITREVRGLPDEHVSSQVEYGYSIMNLQLTPIDNVVTRKGYWYTSHNTVGNVYNCPLRSINYKPQRNGIVLVSESHSLDLFSDLPVYYSEAGGNVKFDTAPDIFHFAFNGHSGDFMLMDDGTVKVFNSDIPSGQVSVTFSPGNIQGGLIVPTVVITTGDGYSYTFGGDITAVDCSYSKTEDIAGGVPDSFYGPSGTVSAMRLTTITAPNGRTALFGYSPEKHQAVSLSVSRRGYRHNTSAMSNLPLSFLQHMAACGQTLNMTDISYESTQATSCYSSLPMWVKVAGSQAITFNYGQRSHDESSSDCFYAYRPINTALTFPSLGFISSPSSRLSGITVTNADGQTVESATLTHSYSSQHSRKLFLSGVSILTRGDYSFSYDHLQDGTFPYNNTTGTDYWGYWNGRDNNPVLYQMLNIDNLGICDLYDQVNGTGKDPDTSYSGYGALSSIVYPTGGRTLLTYEGNSAAARIQNRNEEPFIESVQTFAVGGLRLSKAVHCKSGTERADSVCYAYGDGTLYQMPLYGMAIAYKHIRPLSDVAIPDENYSSTYTLQLEYTSDTHFHLTRDNHIGYGEVTETYADGSRVQSFFTGLSSGSTYDDIYLNSDYEKVSFFCDCDGVTLLDGSNHPCVVPPTRDLSRMRGLLTERNEYDSNDVLRRRTEIGYARDTLYHSLSIYNGIHVYKASYYEVYSPLVSSRRQTVFENGGSVVSGSGTSYNSLCQPVREDMTTGIPGDTATVYRKYLHETNSTALKGIISDAVRTRCSGGTEYIIASEHYNYQRPSVHTKPSGIVSYDIDIPVSVTPADRFTAGRNGTSRQTLFSYDSRLRLTGVSLPGGDTVSYTWSGNNVSSRTRGGSGNTSHYEWKDLVGLTRDTTPSGMYESYTYDSRNRLQRIKDSGNNSVALYEYSLDNE